MKIRDMNSDYSKLFMISLIILLVYLSYQIISPFFIALLSSFLITIATYPLYNKLNKKIKSKNIASILIVLSIVFFIIIPLLFFANALIQETVGFYNSISGLELTDISDNLKEITGINVDFEDHFKSSLLDISNTFINSGAKIREFILDGILHLFVILFTLFFFLRDGKQIIYKIKDSLPFKSKVKKRFMSETLNVMQGLMLGLLIIALLEGIISFIGFYIFNIPNPLVWSFIIVILAMIPMLGPTLVYLPASLYLVLMGNILDGVMLLIYSIITLGYTDNIVRHQIITKTAKVNPVIALVGVFGGIQLMGIPGIIVGPLVLSLFVVIYKIYEEEYAPKG